MSIKDERAIRSRDEGSLSEISQGKSIRLTERDTLDLSGLSSGQISELKEQHAKGNIDLQKKAGELKIDVGALDETLTAFNDQTNKATQGGASATITHTQTSALGRTEIVIGNTEKAAQGKVSRTAAGEQDRTLWIVGIVAAAAIVIALVLAK